MSNMKSNILPKASQGGYPGITPNNQSILLEKLNVRRSTPDSEALASSDDEPDHRQETAHSAIQHQKPVRRASWLNDTSQASIPPVRKSSFASSTMSPTASHPTTPAAETSTGTWGTHSAHTGSIGRSHQPPSTFTWGTGIWNTERSKEPPSRLTEVLQSPTSMAPPGLGAGHSFGGESSLSQTSPGPREVGPNSQIPFAIPLHPTPKTYRSQSYSVGQLEPDQGNSGLPPPTHVPGRGRAVGPSGLQHRPSRPSMLSEMSNEGMLGKVHEVDDDDTQSTHSSGHGAQTHQNDQSKTIELLARENAMLRQQQQYQNSRLRPRASTSYGIGNGYSVREPVPEESDYAVDELDETGEGHDAAAKRALGRRMSEYGAGAFGARSPLYPVENRKLENVKKAYWQSSLGFGGIGDIPQSRRHSFADVPTRQGSISSIGGDVPSLHEVDSPETAHPQDFGGFSDNAGYGATSPLSYFTGGGGLPGGPQAIASSAYANPYGSYGIPPALANRAPSPHRGMYGMGQPRHNQLLHIVLFKCSRADVFYIQEGTGLTVKPGDLVIVEADRGTDLGTVDRSNVDWQTAKELKEHYAEEHYKWLMMYSQNAAAAQEGTGAGLMAASNGMQGGAIGGMGPPSQHHMPEPTGELKPKLIKRLAQSHEIHNLREKEGNEAKAKRVCMQKVKEHGLNMEILDAEFQMDWKKLTFYYFADAYINFNSLVTDLFKIYKTRIWMSAINPASFASPTLGLQAPSGIGPGAVGIGRGSNNAAGNAERRQNQPQENQSPFSGTNSGRSFQSPFGQTFGSDRPVVSSEAYPSTGFPMSAYGAFGLGSRTGAVPYVTGMMPGVNAYGGGFPQGSDFQAMRARYPSPHDASASQDSTVPAISGQNDWAGAFQSLSLNSR
ncbi:putative PSP1 C-terminal domain-containing protein [Seiridium cardinale]